VHKSQVKVKSAINVWIEAIGTWLLPEAFLGWSRDGVELPLSPVFSQAPIFVETYELLHPES